VAEIFDAHATVVLKRDFLKKRKLIKNLEKRFSKGLLEAGDAIALLIAGGIENQEALALVSQWTDESSSKGKELSAAQLCKLRSLGLVTEAAQRAGLMRLGYGLWLRLTPCSRFFTTRHLLAISARRHQYLLSTPTAHRA